MATTVAPTPQQAQQVVKVPTRLNNPTAIFWLLPVLISSVIFTIVPFFYTVYISFTNYSLFHFQQFSWIGFQNFIDIFKAGSGFAPVMGWTVTWMLLATLFNVGGGVLLALMLNHPRLRERNLYRTLLIIPWALPYILTVQVWAGIYNTQGPLNLILGSVGIHAIKWLQDVGPARSALILTNLWLSYPFFMTVSLAALQAIPRELYEVADLDGAGRWDRFKTITWPFMLNAMKPLIVTQLSFQFGNAGIIILLTNGLPLAYAGAQYGSTDTLASFAYKLIYSLRLYGQAAAYSIIIFLIVATFTVINSLLTRSFEEVD